MMKMTRQALHFTAPYEVHVREEELPRPATGQILVRTLVSAISPGTELLMYRGQAPADISLDETIPALAGDHSYPFKYGYAAVGQVVGVGVDVGEEWRWRSVFSFHPHESHFVTTPEDVIPIPTDISLDDAAFLPNMETAVSFLLDGRPLIGEKVVVFGQGIVGLLTTALLARLPLAQLVTMDKYPLRQHESLALGAHASLDPEAEDALKELMARLDEGQTDAGADLTYELSGSPAALDTAIAATGFNGRVVIGSWYGRKRADLNLGGRFHRSRIQLLSSQVSTIAPELTGRWTKARRLRLAFKMLKELKPSRLITHRFPFSRAAKAYATIDQHPEQCIQVILTYGNFIKNAPAKELSSCTPSP
jgi:2-desacetyl-2-hydroxyethyl bacteriochlorophyllide A dehydrogenase